MTSLLFCIILAALFSSTSLFVVLLRVSPLTAPAQALPAFFFSIFLTISTIGCLLLFMLWRTVGAQVWDQGKALSLALRQGFLFALATCLAMFLHLLGLLTWWNTALLYSIFFLIEMALHV